MFDIQYEWEDSYAEVIREKGHERFFERVFLASEISSLVIISPWIGLLRGEYYTYSLQDIARIISQNRIPSYIITRNPEIEQGNRPAVDIFQSCPTINLFYNNELHAKVYVCRCQPFGFALLSSANLSSSPTIEIGLMIEGKGYGQLVIEELENFGKGDLPGMRGTEVAKYANNFIDRL